MPQRSSAFDDIELASLVSPRLTTVRVPRYRLGEELMKGLLRRLRRTVPSNHR